MARPIKPFTQAQTKEITRILWLKSRGVDTYEFEKNLKIDAREAKELSAREHYYQVCFNASETLDTLEKAPSPERLREWIDTYLSPEGWKRIQAAIRQRNHAKGSGNRERLTKMSKEASWDFSYLAEQSRMTKKAYLSELANWMINTEQGKRASAIFSSSLSK